MSEKYSFDFGGKNVLVTGGGAGIGRACAKAFAECGAKLFVAEIDPERCATLRDDYPESVVVQCDVTSADGVTELFGQMPDRLDVLINNVGHFLHAQPFETMSLEQIDEIIAINLRQILLVTRAALPLLKAAAPGPSVISISSIEAFRGIPNCAVYAACKSAITGFTKSLALELGPLGIRVNDIAPETTDTPQVPVDVMIPDKNKPYLDKWIPLGRFGEPEDCAHAALFLASPFSSWITGTAMHVDGGALAAAGWTRDANNIWTIAPVAHTNGLGIEP